MNSLYFFCFTLFFQIIIILSWVILLLVWFANYTIYTEFCEDTFELCPEEVIFRLYRLCFHEL